MPERQCRSFEATRALSRNPTPHTGRRFGNAGPRYASGESLGEELKDELFGS
jgi:hypothetical protein